MQVLLHNDIVKTVFPNWNSDIWGMVVQKSPFNPYEICGCILISLENIHPQYENVQSEILLQAKKNQAKLRMVE